MKSDRPEITRRAFIGTVAAGAGAGAVSASQAPAPTSRPGSTTLAPDGPVLRAGLIGCGGRGRGAAHNFISAGPNLRITALADVFPDRVQEAQRVLRGIGQDIPDSRLFSGFDAYQKLIASDVDVVLHATPPHFRPQHAAAAIDAGKHLFIEKPVAVDVPGSLAIVDVAGRAERQGLSIMTGTQLRRDATRIEMRKRIQDGAIGDIRAIRVFRNQGALWYRVPQPGWSDMEYMLRDWVNWTWLSGDMIVEMHIHHLDCVQWVLGRNPVKATGMGARLRRATGDQYDFFSVDYAYDDTLHLHTTIRQLNGCTTQRQEMFVGTKGMASLDGVIYDPAGKPVWQYDGPTNNALVQEHVDLVTAIRTGRPINAARDTAMSTLMAIMGRDSAYTGQAISWDELLASKTRLGPAEYAFGPVPIEAASPVPGKPPGPPLSAT